MMELNEAFWVDYLLTVRWLGVGLGGRAGGAIEGDLGSVMIGSAGDLWRHTVPVVARSKLSSSSRRIIFDWLSRFWNLKEQIL